MGTKRDTPALGMLEGFSQDWSGLTTSSTKRTLDDAQRYKTRVSDVTNKTIIGISSIQNYVEDVNDGITNLSAHVKTSMIETTQIMANLVDKLVPTTTPSSDQRGKTPRPSSGYNRGSGYNGKPSRPSSSYNRGSGYMSTGSATSAYPKKVSNEEIARQLQENAKSAEEQQKLALLLENVQSTCDKVKSNKGIDSDDIKTLKGQIDDYGKTLENEKDRKERLEKERKQREEEEEREKQQQEKERKQKEEAAEKERQRKAAEERRKNPDSWDPLVLKGGSETDRFTATDILCVVYAMEGSFQNSPLECINMEGKAVMSDWLQMQYEDQASCPIMIKSPGNTLELPMEVYLPYSIQGSKHEPQVKLSVDDGPWKSPDVLTKRAINAFPEGTQYIGTSISNFKSFRIIVVAVRKKTKFDVNKNGLKYTEDCVHLQVPPGFGNDSIKIGVLADGGAQIAHKNFLGAQIAVGVDGGVPTTKDIDVKISTEKLSSHNKERGAVFSGLKKFAASEKDFSNFRLDPFLEQLQKEGVINKKEANDNKNHLEPSKRIEHVLDIILQRPSAAEKVLVCLDKSGNSHIKKQIQQLIPPKFGNTVAEEKWRSVMVYRENDVEWKVLDPRITSKLQKELACTLPAGHRYFEMMSLTVSDDSSENEIKEIAQDFRNHQFGTKVTLICRQKTDDYQAETFIHVLPSDQASKEISRLQDQGYTRGPMELADFTLMDGETVELYMSGNIDLEYKGNRMAQGTVMKFPFKINKDICKVNVNAYVVDKTLAEQMDDDRYRGILHYRVEANKPLKERTDAVEIVLMKVTKRYLSHLSVNGDLQVLGKFISLKMADRKEMHSVFVQMDTPATVKEIEERVERQCKKDKDIARYEATLFIWANQNKDEKDQKIDKLLHAVRGYPWCEEARKLVNHYMKAGLFSEMSLLSMSKLLGPEWKDLAVVLNIPEAQMDYIESLHLSEEDAKGKMLDKFRLSHYAIEFGSKLPQVFLQCLEMCLCSDELLTYVKSKMK